MWDRELFPNPQQNICEMLGQFREKNHETKRTIYYGDSILSNSKYDLLLGRQTRFYSNSCIVFSCNSLFGSCLSFFATTFLRFLREILKKNWDFRADKKVHKINPPGLCRFSYLSLTE
jgi:predicted membrane protein